MTTRRQFVLTTIPASVVLIASTRVGASEPVRLDESDPIAIALGYKHTAAQVDAKKFPAYVAGHDCVSCQLFQAAGGEQWGPCGVIPGKLVNAGGWCAAWVNKA